MFLSTILVGCLISPILGSVVITTIPSNLAMGEKPVYDHATNSVYYVDLFSRAFYRYSLDDGTVHTATVEGDDNYTGFITPIVGQINRFLIGLGDSAAIVNWNGTSSTATKEKSVFPIQPETNHNTFFVDPNNNFFYGGFGDLFCKTTEHQSLFESTPNGDSFNVPSLFNSTVGLALDEKTNTLYHLDTCSEEITGFSYDPSTSRLSNERVVHRFVLEQGQLPCGLAIDDEGSLYSGIYGRGSVLKISPASGQVLDEIALGTPLITSPSFGGPNKDTMYVTSGSMHFDFLTGDMGETVGEPAGSLIIVEGWNGGNSPRQPSL